MNEQESTLIPENQTGNDIRDLLAIIGNKGNGLAMGYVTGSLLREKCHVPRFATVLAGVLLFIAGQKIINIPEESLDSFGNIANKSIEVGKGDLFDRFIVYITERSFAFWTTESRRLERIGFFIQGFVTGMVGEVVLPPEVLLSCIRDLMRIR